VLMRGTVARGSAAALLCLAASFLLLGWYYLSLRQGLLDDVFIYLHVARNGAARGSWQYFTIVDRPALLASSPLKIALLTVASALARLLGFGGATFANAKLVLMLQAPLVWALWYPFWRRRRVAFAWLGVVCFVCGLALDTIVDLDGGLLLCWVATLAASLGGAPLRTRELGWLLPLGLLIRPDSALPVLAAVAVLLGRDDRSSVLRASLLRGGVLAAAWGSVCWLMHVWPIPVTYWGKAALPTLFDEKRMIEACFERLGWVIGHRFLGSDATSVFLGTLVVFGFVLAVARDGRSRLAAMAAVVVAGALQCAAPSNYWWYYENALAAFVGTAVGLLSRSGASPGWRETGSGPVALFAACVLSTLLPSRAFVEPYSTWSMNAPSRAQGYVYLASRAGEHGSYALPGVGSVLIRCMEIGMASYFSGDRAWIWDAGGLAQPLDSVPVTEHVLRNLYPARLREPALADAERLAARAVGTLRVVDVWAMEDRDFATARQTCPHLIEEAAICVSDFRLVGPPGVTRE
jgi:hypothetical protein